MILYFTSKLWFSDYKELIYGKKYNVYGHLSFDEALSKATADGHNFIFKVESTTDKEDIVTLVDGNKARINKLSAFKTINIIRVEAKPVMDRKDYLSYKLPQVLNDSRCTTILRDVEYTKRMFPELYALKKLSGSHKDNYEHTIKVLENVMKISNDKRLYYVALFHDLGKALTGAHSDKNGYSFHLHEQASAKMLKALFKFHDIPLKDYEFIHAIVLYHGESRHVFAETATDSAIRRLYKNLSKYYHGSPAEIMHCYIDFVKCDITTKYDNKRLKHLNTCEDFRMRFNDFLRREEESKFRLAINGNEIMELTGLGPNKELGYLVKELSNRVKSGKLINDKAALSEYVLNYVKEVVNE